MPVHSVRRSVSIFPLAQTQAADLAELLFGSFCVRSPGHPARGFFLFWQPPGPPPGPPPRPKPPPPPPGRLPMSPRPFACTLHRASIQYTLIRSNPISEMPPEAQRGLVQTRKALAGVEDS